MARRAFVPPPTLATDSAPRGNGVSSTRTPSSMGLRPSAPPPASVPVPRPSVPPPPPTGNTLPDSRRSVPPPSGLPGADGISIASCSQLLDRLAAADEAPFIASWIESVLSGRTRTDSTLAVRLLRAYRETGRVDRARDLGSVAAQRAGVVEPARRGASRDRARHPGDHRRPGRPRRGRAPARRPRPGGRTEGLGAARAARHAPDPGPARPEAQSGRQRVQRAPPGRARGRAARGRRLASPGGDDPGASLDAPGRSADGSQALCGGTRARPRPRHGLDERARQPGHRSGQHRALRRGAVPRDPGHRRSRASSRRAGATPTRTTCWRSSRSPPTGRWAALHAIDEALVVLGEIDHPMLRYQLAEHRTWALAMLGRRAGGTPVAGQRREAPRGPRRGRRHRRAGPRRHAGAHARVVRADPRGARPRGDPRREAARGLRHRIAEPRRRPLRARPRRRGRGEHRRRARRAVGREAWLGLPRSAVVGWRCGSWPCAAATAAWSGTPSA